MASITQNKKDGKVVSCKSKACVGRNKLEKQVKDEYLKDL